VGIQVWLGILTVMTIVVVLSVFFFSGDSHRAQIDINRPVTGAMFPVILSMLVLQNVLFVGVVWYFVRSYGTSLSGIGLGKPSLKQIAIGLGTGLAMCLAALAMEQGLNTLLPHVAPAETIKALRHLSDQADAGAWFGQISSATVKVLFILLGAVAAPIGEEVFFRGLVYNTLKARINVPVAIIVSGLLFALIHFNPLALFIIWPMGMVLAYVYEKTGSLWVTITMHVTNNLVAFVMSWITLSAHK
jgi:membrane protease YdiL (CAAX protease family)